ncbi:hypothetical protein FHE72_03925 [Rossellomorea vietnamensis]|uniref:Uncharacterized protein n=1 Tax=Rossellomorea vietnamensis TaxID=218284 RepID=A0A6I6UP58_9BACI|nr:hypothetical protein [Rossellomorea vietnamensis]QHE60280.1 hypothetical protein FHE72_03925 [Rossellomorea vietnamensis]
MKKITPLQLLFGYIISFLSFIHAYQSWMEEREVAFYIYLGGGVLLIFLYSTSLTRYLLEKWRGKLSS